MEPAFLSVKNLSVRINGRLILDDISFTMKSGEQWVITGSAASGKTVFGETLTGRHAFQGGISGIFERLSHPGAMMIEAQHRFKNLQNRSDFYYQQRYNSSDADATVTIRDLLKDQLESGSTNSRAWELVEIFHLDQLLDNPLVQLSNGENKRLQILSIVFQEPALIILDEPFTGLDPDGRILLETLFEKLMISGHHLMLLTSRDYIPPCFNTVAYLEIGKLVKKPTGNSQTFLENDAIKKTPKKFPDRIQFNYPDFIYAVRMNRVSVNYNNREILHDIHWEVKKGSRWVLSGHNGAGKSTLLSLISADNPQAYANDIYLFDRKRGTGESIWEIKQKIGFLSPELQLYFDPASTAFMAIASGLFDTIGLFRQLSAEQEDLVFQWLDYIDCRPYSNQLLKNLPGGVQRLILIARALIKTPPLLILDEPCQGLDPAQTSFIIELIGRYATSYGTRLIFVSHYEDDFPPGVDGFLRLKGGRVV